MVAVEGIDAFSNEESLPCILSSFARINCNASKDGDGDTEAEELVVEIEAEEALEGSTPNRESSSSFQIDPS